MKTIYLREKKSGNFEFSTKENATLRFNTKKAFKEWFESHPKHQSRCFSKTTHYGYIVKATYSQSQTYFYTFTEIEKKLGI